MKIVAIIKPTTHNKKMLQSRGLFSNDHKALHELYNRILSGTTVKLDTSNSLHNSLLKELESSGVRY